MTKSSDLFSKLIKENGTPTLLLFPNAISKAYKKLERALPAVKLYYALKANSHPAIIDAVNQCDGYFDLCSDTEIDLVKASGIESSRCIHTHPIKTQKMIRKAYEYGIRTFVIDNAAELEKFSGLFGSVRLLIRLAVRNPESGSDLSKKFGIDHEADAARLIEMAWKAGVQSLGISFHCGSQSTQPEIFKIALSKALNVIDLVEQKGIKIAVLDIGGGFPVSYTNNSFSIENYCAVIRRELPAFFKRDIEVIAEPGRFIAANAMTLMTKVIGKAYRENQNWYYIDDGVYNSFSGKIYDHTNYPVTILNAYKNNKHLSTIAGPTCDSIDILKSNILLPQLKIGSVLIFEKMGAYTSESASCFNGFPKTKIVVVKNPEL